MSSFTYFQHLLSEDYHVLPSFLKDLCQQYSVMLGDPSLPISHVTDHFRHGRDSTTLPDAVHLVDKAAAGGDADTDQLILLL